MEIIRGYLKLIVFESKNGYQICKFKLSKNKNEFIFIRGYLTDIYPNQLYELNGEYVNDSKYGLNFDVKQISKINPTTNDEIIRYLSGSLFPTIGTKTAELIVKHYKTDVIQRIQTDLETLNKVKGLTKKQINIIVKVFQNISKDDELTAIFNIKGLSSHILLSLKIKYNSEEIKKLLSTDPYALLLKDNFNFKEIDKIYLAFNYDSLSKIRIGYNSWYYLKKYCNSSGDTYIKLEQLTEILIRHFPNLTKNLLLLGLIYIKKQALLVFKNNRIFVKHIYDSEINISQMLYDYNHAFSYNLEELNQKIETIKNEKHLIYNKDQINAIKQTVLFNLLVIIGGPGTGKTTIVDGIFSILKKINSSWKIALTAPTGKAAKRLRDKTKQKAMTIHKLLRFDSITNKFFHNEENPIEYDIIIIDEASMLDSELLANIAKTSVNIKKIILIGDPNQLPSVACGNVLKNIIESNYFTTITLYEVYRQTLGNDILELSYAIQKNYLNYDLNNKEGVKFYELSLTNDILEKVGKIYQEIVPDNYNNYNCLQIIAPMYKNSIGIDQLNLFLQEKINPNIGQKSCKIGIKTYRVYDKVMHLKNRPDQEIYNGDIGIIIDIKQDTNFNNILVVKYDENIIEYSKEMFYDLTLAYACSVHKLQGSEYENVIFVFNQSCQFMMQRNLIYTAITRAKNKLFLVGEKRSFLKGIKKLARIRKTTLIEQIKFLYKKK